MSKASRKLPARLVRDGDTRAKAELDALYAEVPKIDCKGECYDSCGPISMSRVEWARIVKKKGYEPRASSITCPLLSLNRCSVYAIRPTICRLWGVIESMPCPWGCKPDRYLTDAEGYDLLLRAELLSEPQEAEEIARLRQLLVDRPDLVAMSRTLIVPPTKTH